MKAKLFFSSIWAAAIIGLAGCAAMVTGDGTAAAGGVVYVWGELKTSQRSPLENLWSATESAMQDLQLTVTQKDKQGLTGHLTAQTNTGKKIRIHLVESHPQVTEIRIRVGVAGNEAMSQMILEKIRAHL